MSDRREVCTKDAPGQPILSGNARDAGSLCGMPSDISTLEPVGRYGGEKYTTPTGGCPSDIVWATRWTRVRVVARGRYQGVEYKMHIHMSITLHVKGQQRHSSVDLV